MKAIAVIPKSTTQVFWKAVEAGAREGAKKAGVEMVWKGSLNENDPAQQMQILEQFVSEGVGAALFWRRLMTQRSSVQSPLPSRKESLW